jgi:hypothetical protein
VFPFLKLVELSVRYHHITMSSNNARNHQNNQYSS